jgi:hypothetical protein
MSDKLKVRTHYFLGSPYHAILHGNNVVVKLTEKNYKLASKIKKLLQENPEIIFEGVDK